MEKPLDFYESTVMDLLSISEQILDEIKSDKGTDLKNFKSLLKEEFKFDKMKPLNDILKELEKEDLIVMTKRLVYSRERALRLQIQYCAGKDSRFLWKHSNEQRGIL